MIHLNRTVKVESFDAEATVAIGRDRPEFLAVAMLARDLRRPITGRDVCKELLANLPENVGWRVIDRCLHLGLVEREGDRGPVVLSESGATALEHGKVLVPEEGAYRFYYAEDPLLDDPILHVVRLQVDDARTERRNLYRARDEGAGRPAQGDRPPECVGQATKGGVSLSIANGNAFEIREVSDRGEPGPEGSLRLDLRCSSGASPELRLSGSLSGPDGGPALKADMKLAGADALAPWSYDRFWSALVQFVTKVPAATLEQWRRQAGRNLLPVPFPTLPEASRRSFTQDLSVPAVRLQDLGTFEASRIERVEVVPAAPNDAQEWCSWLQWDGIGAFSLPEGLQKTGQQILSRFPFHKPRLLPPAELLAKASQELGDRKSWYLLAPSDLGLWSNP